MRVACYKKNMGQIRMKDVTCIFFNHEVERLAVLACDVQALPFEWQGGSPEVKIYIGRTNHDNGTTIQLQTVRGPHRDICIR
jgi:hypothetical protein